MESSRACEASGQYLVCGADAGDGRHWEMRAAPGGHEARCQQDSVPHELLTKCHGVNLCYEDEHGAAYCTRSIDPALPQFPTHDVVRAPVTYTRPLTYSEVARDFEACFVAPYSHASNTAHIGHVRRGAGKEACERLVSGFCTTKECRESLIPVFDEGHSGCAVNDHNMPVKHANDDEEWWRWKRQNFFTCKDAQGWFCPHREGEETSKYTAPRCTRDEDCDAQYSFGVCDFRTHACALGPKQGHACVTHENCDLPVEEDTTHGKCVAGRCASGYNGVEPVYHIPKKCTMPDPKSSKTKYGYCGEAEEGEGVVWHGICAPYSFKGQEFTGCKPFESVHHMREIEQDEEEFQREHRKHVNMYYSSHDNPWQNLRTCSNDHDGFSKVCTETHDKVKAFTEEQSCASLLPYATTK